jgi:arylsulfatase A-like enzyme/predicted Zn-dependent protease
MCILLLAAFGTGLAAVGGWRYARASAPVNGPIFVISIDTLRADHLPVYGYRKVRTPAIDALAHDGVVFERAYSHSPQTLPAHASLLSGRLPFETGVRDNLGFVIKAGERLLPQMLRERGYATGGVVSAYVLRKETGIGQGFDFFDGEMPPRSPERLGGPVKRDGAESEAIAEHWLDSLGSSRAFLFLHLNEPHKPHTPPARFAEFAPYDGEIAYADEIVGRLVRYLKAHQLYDRSTIVLLSDHGEGLGDHGEQEHGLFVYEEAIHVPLIIKQAGGTGAGRRVSDLVQHLDLVPTVLDLVKAPVPGNLGGRSLKPLLDATGGLPGRAIYSEALYGRYHFGWSELTALTDGRYRYIKAPREELYDLERDPGERENVADDPGKADDARQVLRSVLERLVADTTIPSPSTVSADARERLQTLGYVRGPADVVTSPGSQLPDPKDKREIIERYRAAVDLAGERKWSPAMSLLHQVLREEPELAGVWDQLAAFAIRAERWDQAIDAYKHFIELRPADANGYIAEANALLKVRRLEEARQQAELAASVAGEHEGPLRAAAHEVLANIALMRHDAEVARDEAELAHQADPALPMPAYIDARLLYDQARYADALPFFEQANAELRQSKGLQIPELHFYTGDTLERLERFPEAEAQFLEELHDFPQNTRALASLATLYHATGRADDATRVIANLMRTTPTPDAYALAARLLTTFGHRQQADAVRVEARRAFGAPRAAGRR